MSNLHKLSNLNNVTILVNRNNFFRNMHMMARSILTINVLSVRRYSQRSLGRLTPNITPKENVKKIRHRHP